MAAIAAYFAFRTYQSARDDIARLEQRASEPSYLNLLERRFDVLDRVRRTQYHRTNLKDLPQRKDINGQQLIDKIVGDMRVVEEKNSGIISSYYTEKVLGTSGLSNLFRFTYHIISYADRQFSQIPSLEPMVKSDPAYQYIRLLRAQMSDSELVLIALNCAFGPGHDKFKPLVERYALLHNMSRADIALFGLTDLFEREAFGLELKDRVRTDAPVIIEPDPREPSEQ